MTSNRMDPYVVRQIYDGQNRLHVRYEEAVRTVEREAKRTGTTWGIYKLVGETRYLPPKQQEGTYEVVAVEYDC